MTNGDVNYLDRDTAFSSKLVGVNGANVFIKVDNTTNVPYNEKRNTIRLDSMDSYGLGSLWVIDVVHMPFGCSVWPSFWTRGDVWPEHGEIDIIEGINKVTQNQMALHTLPGCSHASGTNQLGTPSQNPDCNQQNGTAGCTVLDTTNKPTYGPNFNSVGGGVWATQFDESGIFIWFFDRASVPDSLKKDNTAKSIDISSWGAPVASYPSTQCSPMSNFFGDQTLVLDITLCGDWAGNVDIYPQTCANQPPNTPNPGTPPPGRSACYFNNVVGPGSPLYDEAYFEISYVRAYATGAALAAETGSTTGASGSKSTGTSGSSTSGAPSQTGNSGTAMNLEVRTFTMAGVIGFAGIVVGALMI